MLTNIIIDDVLMTDVLNVTGIKSKREAVEQGLRTPGINATEKNTLCVIFC